MSGFEWIKAQREAYKQGKLTEERARLLESIPDWTWAPRRSATSWTAQYEALKRFIEDNGRYPTAGDAA